MKPAPLQRHLPRFDERNDFAYGLLGVCRLADALRTEVERAASAERTAHRGAPDEVLYLVLGAYALAQTISELKASLPADVSLAAEPLAPQGSSGAHEGLLR